MNHKEDVRAKAGTVLGSRSGPFSLVQILLSAVSSPTTLRSTLPAGPSAALRRHSIHTGFSMSPLVLGTWLILLGRMCIVDHLLDLGLAVASSIGRLRRRLRTDNKSQRDC